MYITPQKTSNNNAYMPKRKHIYLHFSPENFGDFAIFKESPPTSGQQDLRIRQFPCTRSKQDSVTVPAMGK